MVLTLSNQIKTFARLYIRPNVVWLASNLAMEHCESIATRQYSIVTDSAAQGKFDASSA